MNTLGQRIRELRTSARLSQRALAKICDCSGPTISDLENGKTGAPSAKVLAAMCKYFNKSERYILFGEDGNLTIPTKEQQKLLELISQLPADQLQPLIALLVSLVPKQP